MKKFSFNNGDLQNDIEKIMTYSILGIDKNQDDNLDLPYIIDVNDNSYFYKNVLERNIDFGLLRQKINEQL
jgi:hypothetical protein